ncbi:allantoate transport protein [Chaetomidium leptoderma]|uniref:Allantoate transport protein n=1 Tax=Chaetomidium leptoderma TaxID=669021 RepID=A0AAN6ZUQ9_9PEZI|nr:allantoate transport protein [Chaetomidium leptoderma]
MSEKLAAWTQRPGVLAAAALVNLSELTDVELDAPVARTSESRSLAAPTSPEGRLPVYVAKLDIHAQIGTHYAPVNEEEKELDKRVNLKLDFTVLLVLAISFILCGIDKTNIGFVATSSFVKDANLHPDDIPNSLSLSGFTQTAFYYMSLLWPRYSLGLRMGLFTGIYSVAGAFAGLLAYGLLYMDGPRLHGWQVVFLFEGGLTVVMAVVAWFVLPRDVGTAWVLSARERQYAVRRMERDLAGVQEAVEFGGRDNRVTVRDIVDVLKDWKKMLIILFNITSVLPGIGYSGVEAILISVPPFVVGTVGLTLFVISSDRFRERSVYTVVGMLLGLIGCAVMAGSSDPKLRYSFTHLYLSGVFAGGPLIAANLAGVIAGQLFKSSYIPSYSYPLTVTMILTAVGMVGFLFVRGIYILENKKRRKIIAGWDKYNFIEEQNSSERRGDQRYIWIYGY